EMGLLVGVEPDYYITLEESDAFYKGKKGQVVVSLSNTGPADIKFLTIELEESDDFVIFSNFKTYVGNLEPDDYETAEFEIYTKKSGDIPLKINIDYRDNYNTKRMDSHILTLKSYTAGELKKYGLPVTKSNLNQIIGYLLLVIFIYLTYKNWKKERDIVKASKNSLATMIRGFFSLLGKLRWRYVKRIPRKIQLFLASS
ncbi:MAG: hypothetical protein KKA79_01460, partial [Nanoarchaeota archaeon]|nr:hypothetical protein [Nanoarchaeota archaeon]